MLLVGCYSMNMLVQQNGARIQQYTTNTEVEDYIGFQKILSCHRYHQFSNKVSLCSGLDGVVPRRMV